MLAKLVKFVLLTRFSKPFLGLIGFLLVYETAIGTLTRGTGTGVSQGFSYYAIGASIFFLTMGLLLGGLFVLKSDRDYLLTLPLRRRDLSVSLFIAQFIGYGITILFLYGYYVAGTRDLATTITVIANLGLLACVVTALGVVSNILETWKRLGLALALGAWCLSSILGFGFTPVSAFNGNLLAGTAAMLLLTALVVPTALRELANVELGSIRTMLRTTGSEYKTSMSFTGKSPIRAVYSYHLSFLELVGRFNIGGSTSYRTTRVKTRTVLAISILAGSAYFTVTALFQTTGLLPARIRYEPLVFILPIFLGVVVLLLMSQGTLSNERGWLAFTAMDPARYLRHLLLSRVLSTLAIIGPFGIADIVLTLRGESTGANSAIVLLATVPAASILATYTLARVGAVYQVKEEGMMPGQFDLRQFLAILPIYAVIGLIIASEISLIAAIAIAFIVSASSTLLMSRASIWRGIAARLTERGFV